MDPDNAVVRLCVMGVEAQAGLRHAEAKALFLTAWRRSTNDIEACFAAHYMARLQTNPDQALWWNQIALARADADGGDEVRAFYASLHLNLALSHEAKVIDRCDVGSEVHARHHFQRAAESLDAVPKSSHRVLVEYFVKRGLERTAAAS